MDEKKVYSIALVGCGRIGVKHIEAIAANAERLRLSATCDPVVGRAEEQAAEYNRRLSATCDPVIGRAEEQAGEYNRRAQEKAADIAVYEDYRDALDKLKPDIVSVAAESGKHFGIARDCLEAGCHVICEKPMALSTRDADEMIALARRGGRKLAVCFQNRFNPPVARMRAALEAGRFGRVLHGMVQTRWNRDDAYYAEAPWRGTWEQDGGTLMNQCIHGIDLLQWMMGEDAARVQAQTRRFMRPIEAEDFGAAIVEFRSGAVGIIEGSADVFPLNLSETLSVFGQKGMAVVSGLAVNRIETWRFADAADVGDIEAKVLAEADGAKTENTAGVYGCGHTAVYADFVEAIDNDRDPAVSGESGRKALELVLAIYKSQQTGKPVDLPCDFSTLEMKGCRL